MSISIKKSEHLEKIIADKSSYGSLDYIATCAEERLATLLEDDLFDASKMMYMLQMQQVILTSDQIQRDRYKMWTEELEYLTYKKNYDQIAALETMEDKVDDLEYHIESINGIEKGTITVVDGDEEDGEPIVAPVKRGRGRPKKSEIMQKIDKYLDEVEVDDDDESED